ncbi:MAG: uncharacterized protein JWP08_464 [Bryobacterales bacterium]|nr:uncharacterized protein [Bryobacterales bacterium]
MHHRDRNHSVISDASNQPTTTEGKSVSSQNVAKTTLTGRAVLVSAHDADRYASHLQAFFEEIAPAGRRETLLTQSLADIAWRLEQIASLEMLIYASDRTFYADRFTDERADVKAQLIELAVYQSNERQLRNLQIQEARLRRERDRDNEELRYLQAERRRAAEHQMQLAAHTYQQAKKEEKPYDPAALGFVFSTDEIERFLILREAEGAIAAHRQSAVPALESSRRKRRPI